MKQIFAAVVEEGGQVFYVGEEEEKEAITTLARCRPLLIGSKVVFYAISGQVAEFLKLKKGEVRDWHRGTTIVLEKLSGPIAD